VATWKRRNQTRCALSAGFFSGLLNRNGNLVSTRVEMPSNVAGLDQSVVFATKQTSFPLPPYNANDADLVFIVTYIYE